MRSVRRAKLSCPRQPVRYARALQGRSAVARASSSKLAWSLALLFSASPRLCGRPLWGGVWRHLVLLFSAFLASFARGRSWGAYCLLPAPYLSASPFSTNSPFRYRPSLATSAGRISPCSVFPSLVLSAPLRLCGRSLLGGVGWPPVLVLFAPFASFARGDLPFFG